MKKVRLKYKFSSVKKAAIAAKTRKTFRERYPRYHDFCLRHNLLNEIFNTLPNKGYAVGRMRNGSITIDLIKAKAKMYRTRTEFGRSHPSLYTTAYRNQWMDMIFKERSNNGFSTLKARDKFYCSKKNVMKAASACKTKAEFQKEFRGAYDSAKRNGWFGEATRHMQVQGNYSLRKIYALENREEMTVYVGLSYRPIKRLSDHKKHGMPYIRDFLSGEVSLKVITPLLNYQNAQRSEKKVIERYRKSGWTIMNRAPAGGLGAFSVYGEWDFHFFASWCDTRAEMRKCFSDVYNAAQRAGKIDEIFENHIGRGLLQRPKNFLSKMRVKSIARSYNTRREFQQADPSAYMTALKNGWIEETFRRCKNKGYKTRPPGFWTFERLSKLAAKCKTRHEMFKRHHTAYFIAADKGILDNIFAQHANSGFINTPKGTWSANRLHKLAKEFPNRKAMKAAYSGAYGTAERLGIVNNIFHDHVNSGYLSRPPGFWNIKRALAVAGNCKSRSDMKAKYWGGWDFLRREGLLNRIFPSN